ncbi:MAG: hypothetical protein V4617_15100 [Gemmatimonadota bacterium]
MASIEWEDATGYHTLTSNWPEGPARRFAGWSPTVKPIGPAKVALGTGRRYQYQFRRDHLTAFEMPGLIPSQFAEYLAFRVHALAGCDFYVICDDADANIYTCRLAPETEPELTMTDPQQLEYTMAVTVKNTANEPMLCNYRG